MHTQTAIATAFCFHFAFAKLTTFYIQDRTEEQIIDCAIKIVNQTFDLRKLTVVLHKDVDDTLVNKFLESYAGTVIVESKKDGVPTKQVIVLVNNYLSFMRIFYKLEPDIKEMSLLRNGAKFLIIFVGSAKKMKRITSIMWSYWVTDVVMITRNKKNDVLLYTYFPYKNHLNCQNTKPEIIGFCNDTATKNVYPDKLKNMNQCPLYISTNKIKYPLTEKKIPLEIIKKTIVKLLRDIMNFTPIISVKEYISIDSSRARNWSDSLSDVINGVANLSTCSIPLNIDRLGLLDYSMPYFRERLVWLAPTVTSGPGWWRLLSPLNGYLWLVLLLVIFFVKSVPIIMKIKPARHFSQRFFKNSSKLRSIVFKIWGILVGQPVRILPRKFRDFYIVGLWMWFTFVVRSAYQSVLIGALKTDTIIGNFASIREAVDTGYDIGGRMGIYVYFEYDAIIRERFKQITEEDFEKIFYDVIQSRRHFVLATSLEYASAYCLAFGKTEKECGHMLPDSIMSVPLVIWMKVHSPFKKPLMVWLPRMFESGFLQFSGSLSNPSSYQTFSDPSPLTHHHILSCMLCLLVGYLVSTAVFVVELVRFKAEEYTIETKRPFRH